MTAVSAQVGLTGEIRPDGPEESCIRVRGIALFIGSCFTTAMKGGWGCVFSV
jgi:hypothetical protein